MKSTRTIRSRSSLFRIAVVLGTAILWVIVAIQQYQWVRELSVISQGRSGANLQSVMKQWHRDLYEDLSSVCIAMQVGPDSGAHDAWNDYLQRYAEWIEGGAGPGDNEPESVNPELVKNIYEWSTPPQLLRLNARGKTLDSAGVPAEMQNLLARLRVNSSSVQMAMHAWEFGGSSAADSANPARSRLLQSNALAGWQLDDKIPALVRPVLHHADPFNSQTAVDRTAVDWIIVVLDLGIIRNRIFPGLANHYFGSSEGLDYRVAVVDTDAVPRMIYSSDPRLTVEGTTQFDSVMNIFSSSATALKSEFWRKLKENRNMQEETWQNFTAPAWFPVFHYSTADEPWVLVLQHRKQPLSQIAKTVRQRNLLTGGVVLVLLAANIGLILFASHRAENLANAQMEFLASASHELLTPLSAIYCSGQNAKDGLLRTDADRVTDRNIITRQARQLIELVKQNLMFAATESQMATLVLVPLRISDIFERLRENIAWQTEDTGCHIEYKIQPGLPMVLGDLLGVTQCLQNLVGNAIKYSGNNQTIEVIASVVKQGKNPEQIQISVQDHGRGISSVDLQHIFEPFYRSPAVVVARIHGAGLGLTVAARIAKAMRGKLSVTSQVGAGSTFVLHLPAAAAPAEVPLQPVGRDVSVAK